MIVSSRHEFNKEWNSGITRSSEGLFFGRGFVADPFHMSETHPDKEDLLNTNSQNSDMLRNLKKTKLQKMENIENVSQCFLMSKCDWHYVFHCFNAAGITLFSSFEMWCGEKSQKSAKNLLFHNKLLLVCEPYFGWIYLWEVICLGNESVVVC